MRARLLSGTFLTANNLFLTGRILITIFSWMLVRILRIRIKLGLFRIFSGLSFRPRNYLRFVIKVTSILLKALTQGGTTRSRSPAPVSSPTTPLALNEKYSPTTSLPNYRHLSANSFLKTSFFLWLRIICISHF